MKYLLLLVFVFITIIASFSLSQVYAEPIVFDGDFIIEKFVVSLEYPTAMTFVGDDMLVLEKNTGKIIRIQDNGTPYNEPVLDLPVEANWESGLLGITSISNHVFLYFTESESGFDLVHEDLSYGIDETGRNRVYQYDWDGEKLTNPILIKELPGNLSDLHHGGVMTKGLNNEVYFVIGDQDQHTTFQNIPGETNYETGAIFKINTDEDNRFELFAMGIRNSFGLAVDPITGYLWDTENGPDKFDEINLVKPRFNSGWKTVMGPADKVDHDLSTLNPEPFENFEYSEPEFSWELPVGVTAIVFPDNDSFGKYTDWLFVGDINNGRIYKFQLNADRTGFVFSNPELSDLVLDYNDDLSEIHFASNFQGITDIKFHDGVMYVVVFRDGIIYKIYPKEPLSPLKQYQNGVTHKKIVCKPGLMPIMKNSGYISCVYPKTALTLINVLNWSIDHPEMPKTELRFQDLSGLNFEYINLSNSDLTGSNFDNTKISNVNFAKAHLSYTDLSGKDLTGTILKGADLSNSTLTDVVLSGMDLSGTILRGVDLSGKDLTGTILKGADLSYSNLSDTDLSDMNLAKTILLDADFTNTIVPDVYMSGKNFNNAIFNGVDLSGKDLSSSKFQKASFHNANLENVNLSEATLIEVDFTKIKNKSLAGANLFDTSLAHSFLSGVNLTDAILKGTNFWKADLSGQDFTVISDTSADGITFMDANLSNSNFEGVDLSPQETFYNIFKDEAYLVSGHQIDGDLKEELFGKFSHILILSAEVSGNDLAVKYLFFNSFAHANLENANFKNTKLWHANFYSANLTNADLSGADLRKAFLGNANLSNADLSGANLSGAILDENTILKCLNHPICKSG